MEKMQGSKIASLRKRTESAEEEHLVENEKNNPIKILVLSEARWVSEKI